LEISASGDTTFLNEIPFHQKKVKINPLLHDDLSLLKEVIISLPPKPCNRWLEFEQIF